MSHLKRLINRNILQAAKRTFGADSHATHAPADVPTGGFAKDGSILFRNWEGKNVYGKPGEFHAIQFSKDENKLLYEVFKTEMFGAHPTKSFDKAAFAKYSPEQLAKLNSIPKYSRPVTTFMGNRREPRVFWLFPLYFTVTVVGHTYLCELVDEEYWTIPLKYIFPEKKEAV